MIATGGAIMDKTVTVSIITVFFITYKYITIHIHFTIIVVWEVVYDNVCEH